MIEHRNEVGFTIIELSISMALIAGLLIALSGVAVTSLKAVALARERIAANGLADEAMEQLRALPFATVSKGLDDLDLAAEPNDPAIVVTGSGYSYNGEAIPHGSNATPGYTQAPLVPHRSTQSVNQLDYTVATYPTLVANSPGVIRVTVVVSWDKSASPGAEHSVSSESLIAQPTGCMAGSGHPYVAPCQPFHYASALSSSGSVSASGSVGELDLDEATLALASITSNLQAEQVTADNGVVTATGGLLTEAASGSQTSGGAAATVHSDDDPASSANLYSSAALASQAAGNLSLSDSGGNWIAVTTSGADVGGAQAAALADALTSPCRDLTGLLKDDDGPCGAASLRQANPSRLEMGLSGTSSPFTLASVDSSVEASRVFVAKYPASGAGHCVAASGDGCAAANASLELGAMTFGGLPAEFNPGTGWNGSLVQMSPYSVVVTAESGLGAAAPAITVANSPVISFWNGAGYTTVLLTSGSTPSFLDVQSANASDPASGYSVSLSASLSTGGLSVSDPDDCGPVCTRATATALSNAPLIGSITLTVTHGGDTVANVSLAINTGTCRADTSYQESPSVAP